MSLVQLPPAPVAGPRDWSVVNRTIGSNARAEIARAGFSNSRAAHAIGLNPRQIHSRIHGQVAFSASELLALAAWLGVPLAELTRGIA